MIPLCVCVDYFLPAISLLPVLKSSMSRNDLPEKCLVYGSKDLTLQFQKQKYENIFNPFNPTVSSEIH